MEQTSPTTSFPPLARKLRGRIDEALDGYARWDDGCPARLAEAIRYSLLAPGKRLRPCLVLMAADACGYDDHQGANHQGVLPAACAVEMIHAYSLIHDDLPAMDDDDLRRGRPSCHAKYDEATAILAGDALLARAFEILAADIQPADVAVRCCRELAQAAGAAALVGGQADDLGAQFAAGDIELLKAIHRRKTGAMIRVALRMGGLVASAEPSRIAALDRYGDCLGLAFQIVDDLLDHAGDPQALGKRTGKDSALGKLTFPGLLGVEQSNQEARRLIGEAGEAIQVFGARAQGLETLARYVLERNH